MGCLVSNANIFNLSYEVICGQPSQFQVERSCLNAPVILVSSEISWPPALLGVLGVTQLLHAALLLGGGVAALLVSRAALLPVHGAAPPLRHHLARAANQPSARFSQSQRRPLLVESAY